MALINCSDCEKQVSSSAKSCIHCGAPLKSGTTRLTITRKSSLNAAMRNMYVYVDNVPQGTLKNGKSIEIVRESGFSAYVDTNVGGLSPRPAVIPVSPGQDLHAAVSFSLMGGVTAKVG